MTGPARQRAADREDCLGAQTATPRASVAPTRLAFVIALRRQREGEGLCLHYPGTSRRVRVFAAPE
jgi:hypothetical protein